MNFRIGEKIRIKNTTDKTISLATLRHNFSYDIKPKEELVFPITSVEQGAFYVKQNRDGLEITLVGK